MSRQKTQSGQFLRLSEKTKLFALENVMGGWSDREISVW